MNGELPPDDEILHTLNRARVLFHRFGEMMTAKVEGMMERDITAEDLEFLNGISDLTEVFDETVTEVRNVYDSLGDAVGAYREQAETAARSQTDTSPADTVSEDTLWLAPTVPPPTSTNNHAASVKPHTSQLDPSAATHNQSMGVREQTEKFFAGAARHGEMRMPLNELVRRLARKGDISQVPDDDRKIIEEEVYGLIDSGVLSSEVAYKNTKTEQNKRIIYVFLNQ